MKGIAGANWTDSQRQFVQNLKDVGATEAKKAVVVDRSMALPRRELMQLLDSGVVREAGENRYYAYTPSRQAGLERHLNELAAEPDFGGGTRPFDKAKMVKLILFWLIVIALPMLMIQLLGRKG